MSDTLKNDTEFIEELKELQDKSVDAHVALVENPSLASNPEFMKEAIKQDANLLKNVDPSLKNDYKFMKEVTQINYEAVGQVIKNRKDFGLEGIKGAKETTRELTTKEYMEIIDDMAEHSEDDRYARVKEKVAEKGVDNPLAVKWITAMAAQNKDNVSTENFQKVFDYSILTMTKIQKDLTEDGNIKITKENTAELIRPQILNKLREAAAEKGLKITEEQEKLFEEYEEFHKMYMEKLREQKKQNLKNSNNLVITPEQIESRAEGLAISAIKEQTQEIREEYVTQTKEKVEGETENEHTEDETR